MLDGGKGADRYYNRFGEVGINTRDDGDIAIVNGTPFAVFHSAGASYTSASVASLAHGSTYSVMFLFETSPDSTSKLILPPE